MGPSGGARRLYPTRNGSLGSRRRLVYPVASHPTGGAMKRLLASGVAGLVLALASCGHMQGDKGWISLIDGSKGMENWSISGATGNWRAEDGAIQADQLTAGKGASVLVSNRSFKDFELYVEFW